MAKIISISSQVSQGFVGNSAIEFALQRIGHEVWTIPSVLLSNHPAYEHFGGIHLKPSMLRPILEGLDMNDFFDDVDAIITGYLPTADLVAFAIEAVSLVKAVNPDALYLCDPVFGDDPIGKARGGTLFIDDVAARTNKYELLPLANIITPNRFELEWLADMPVHSVIQAQDALEKIGTDHILASSIPDGSHTMTNLLKVDGQTLHIDHERFVSVPHGTGDLQAAFYLATLCDTRDPAYAFAQSTAYVQAIIKHSQNSQELNLIGSQHLWTEAKAETMIPQKQKTKLEK